MTVFGWVVIASKVKRSSIRSSAKSFSLSAVFFSNASHAFTAILPLLVEDKVRIASDMWRSVTSLGQPWLMPGSSTTPFTFFINSYSSAADQVIPLMP
ncbi:hypothetical protein D3C71_1974220 [compost metagenome]